MVLEPEEEHVETQEPVEHISERDSGATAPVDKEEPVVEAQQTAEPAEKRPEYPKRDRIATGGLKKVT